MTCRKVAKHFKVDPNVFLIMFMREFDVFERMSMDRRLMTGTDVPDPHNNADFDQCAFDGQACTAALHGAGQSVVDSQRGGRSPSDKQIAMRNGADVSQQAKDDHFHKSLQDSRRPTFTIIERCKAPKGKRVIRSGWTHNAVFDADGDFIKWKSRSFAHGQTQVAFDEYDPYGCSSVPARKPTIRLVCGIAAEIGFIISQGDFTAAYLEAKIDEEVFVELPAGISGVDYIGQGGQNRVGRCERSYFGLHQCGKNWELALCTHVMSLELHLQFPFVDKGSSLDQLGIQPEAPIRIGVDNTATVLSARNASGKRTRHVDICFHRVREAIRGKRIEVDNVRGGSSVESEQKADIMTESCSGPLFDKFDWEVRGIRDG